MQKLITTLISNCPEDTIQFAKDLSKTIPYGSTIFMIGDLGSGKTTLLRRWRTDKSLHNAAFIIHDFSEYGVDVELVADETSSPKAGQLVDRVAALHGVHARDKLNTSAHRVLGQIAALEPAPPHIVCESTGAARPWPLIAALTQDELLARPGGFEPPTS